MIYFFKIFICYFSVIKIFKGNHLQECWWWGPEFAIEFDITVWTEKLPWALTNIFQISKRGNYPKQENIPGVWVISDKASKDQRIAIEFSYVEGFIHFDYVVGQKYQIKIIQTSYLNYEHMGPKCTTWPKKYGVGVYVDDILINSKEIRDIRAIGEYIQNDYTCPEEPCDLNGWCHWCDWLTT